MAIRFHTMHFVSRKFRPDYYFIYLNEKVKDAPNILKLPEGDYLCFRERILEEAWESSKDHQLFSGKGKARTDACDGI